MTKNYWIKRKATKDRTRTILVELHEMMAAQGHVFKLYGKVVRSMRLDGNEVVFELDEDQECN